MLLLQSLWERVLLIQQIKVVFMGDENKTWHAYIGLKINFERFCMFDLVQTWILMNSELK